MKVVLTGANGSFGREYRSFFPHTVSISVRYKDMASYWSLANELSDGDVLIHASSNLKPHSLPEAIADNALLPLDIIDIVNLLKKKIHLIFISSMSILSETTKPKRMRDMNDYALSKYLMEEMLHRFNGLPITIVRFSTLFFRDDSKDGLSAMINNAANKGSIVAADCRRDFLPIDLAVKCVNKMCLNKEYYNKTINLASGVHHNLVDIANHLKDKYKVSFHNTILPLLIDVCYEFSKHPAHDLIDMKFDIYELIDKYYRKVKNDKGS